ncbi:MAG: glycosyltransferase family 4 protein [Saprospiraceae bacterium]
MKILIISNYKDAYNSVRPEGEIFIGLQKLGFQLTIMTQADAPFVDNFRKAGIPIIDFHPTKKISRKAILFIRQALKKGQYDILHLFNSKAISNGNFAAIGLPVKVLAYRGVIGGSAWYAPNSYLKHLHPRVDGITAVSKSVQTYLQQQLFWHKQKVSQFYKGQNLTWYQGIQPANLQELGIPKDAFVVTCIANNRTWKGIKYLIQAAQYLALNLPIHFLLIGRKMDTSQNLQLIQSSPYSTHFHLVGYRNDVLQLLAASDVYIQPSNKNREGLGKAILEAMSLGIPPIVTNSGGPKEFVEHQVSGLVVPTKNPKAIAQSIQQLFDNESFRTTLGNGAKKVIAGKMSLEASVLALKQIYETI